MDRLRAQLGRRVSFAEPLSGHTTWGVGGPAWALCRVRTADEAAAVLTAARAVGRSCLVLGRGSNLLVADAGFPGVVLRLEGELAALRVQGNHLTAGGGATLAQALQQAADASLAGLEWAAGIPGTVGGAVAGNAGAHGRQMSDLTAEVSLLLADGRVVTTAGGDLPADYRRRELPAGALVLAARLELTPADPAAIRDLMRRAMQARRQSQPLGARTAGSVFKNPPGDYAGRLIEACGCKGLAVGDAVVSSRHANFIENRGAATAGDVLGLMRQVADRVKREFGVELEPEVRVVGDV